jgi:hypothetical protein
MSNDFPRKEETGQFFWILLALNLQSLNAGKHIYTVQCNVPEDSHNYGTIFEIINLFSRYFSQKRTALCVWKCIKKIINLE